MEIPANVEQPIGELVTRHLATELPMVRQDDVQFADEQTAARLDAALAFGAVTARVLAPRGANRDADAVDLLCATFNLGIGLVDGLCDGDVEAGGALLGLLLASDVATAAEAPRPRGWLRSVERSPDDRGRPLGGLSGGRAEVTPQAVAALLSEKEPRSTVQRVRRRHAALLLSSPGLLRIDIHEQTTPSLTGIAERPLHS